jgi:hypothetical protein
VTTIRWQKILAVSSRRTNIFAIFSLATVFGQPHRKWDGSAHSPTVFESRQALDLNSSGSCCPLCGSRRGSRIGPKRMPSAQRVKKCAFSRRDDVLAATISRLGRGPLGRACEGWRGRLASGKVASKHRWPEPARWASRPSPVNPERANRCILFSHEDLPLLGDTVKVKGSKQTLRSARAMSRSLAITSGALVSGFRTFHTVRNGSIRFSCHRAYISGDFTATVTLQGPRRVCNFRIAPLTYQEFRNVSGIIVEIRLSPATKQNADLTSIRNGC